MREDEILMWVSPILSANFPMRISWSDVRLVMVKWGCTRESIGMHETDCDTAISVVVEFL